MVVTNQVKNQHLVWRAGFGPDIFEVQKLAEINPADHFAAMMKSSQKKPAYIDVANDLLQGFVMGVGEIIKNNSQNAEASQQKKRQFAKESRERLKSLNLQWLDEMVGSQAQLREKMSLFWHGHFACRNINIFFQQQLLHDIRSNALENFGDLLMAVSKNAAMLAFLNNQQNKKSHPNENFAREVMELFTLGRGNYTETDVKEAARAFTGWSFDLQGEFVFRRFQHDDGIKAFLGRKGNFDGEDIIRMLLERKETAVFITRKLYRFFVNDLPDENNVQWLAGRFYQGNYNISALMKDIFTSAWFYDAKNIGCHIKSPVELMAGVRRILPMELQNDESQLLLQRALGQILFYPPNVAGWPGGTNWIDSSALMLRLRFPQLVAGNDVFSFNPKTDDDQQMGMQEEATQLRNKRKKQIMMAIGARNKFVADINWPLFVKQFDSVPKQHLLSVLEAVMLQTAPGSISSGLIDSVANKTSREEYIKSTAVALMSTPEYQLC